MKAESRTVVFGTASRIAALGAFAIFTIGSARHLGAERRGDVAFVIQAGYLVGAVLALGRERGAYTGVRPIERPSALSASLLSIVLLAPLALYAISDAWPFDVAAVLSIAVATALSRILEADLIRRRSSARLVVLQLSSGLALLAGLGMLILSSSQTPGQWILAFVLPLAAPPLVLLCTLPPDPVVDEPAAPDADGDLRLLAMGDVGIAVAQRMDRVIMGIAGQSAALGRYSVVSAVVELAALPVAVASRVRSKLGSRHGRRIEVLAWIASIVLLVGLWAFGDTIVRFLAGSEFVVGRPFWALLGVATISINLYRAQSAERLRDGRVRNVAWTDVLAGLSCLLVYIAMIPPFGMVGGAVGTLVGYAIASLVLWWATVRRRRGEPLPALVGPTEQVRSAESAVLEPGLLWADGELHDLARVGKPGEGGLASQEAESADDLETSPEPLRPAAPSPPPTLPAPAAPDGRPADAGNGGMLRGPTDGSLPAAERPAGERGLPTVDDDSSR